MIRIVAPQRERAEELYDLAAKIFSGGGYFEFLRTCRGGYFAGSSYDWSASRVAEDDGRMVAHVGIWRYRMRVGRARLRTAGIGAVMTHGDYRRRGTAARVFAALFPAMRQAGYHYTVLFGIRDFYDRFGYVPTWPSTQHIARLDALPDVPLKLKLRKVPKSEVLCGTGAVMRIYERENAARTGSAERPIYTLTRGLVGNFECRTLCDSAGRTFGYVVTGNRGGDLEVLEAGGMKAPCGAGQLLAAMKVLARRKNRSRIRLNNFSYDHPLCRALRGRDCSVEMHHARSGGAMAAAVSLRGCLEAMAGELTDRLRRSAMKGFTGGVNVSGAGDTVTLDVRGGRVRVAPKARKSRNRIVAGRAVAKLLIGSAGPAALAMQSGISFAGRAAELAEALFPEQWPMLSLLDHF